VDELFYNGNHFHKHIFLYIDGHEEHVNLNEQ
jgi:hypothetical protein